MDKKVTSIEIYNELSKIRVEIEALRGEIAIIKDWRKTVKLYTYSVWAAFIALLAKKFSL